MLCPTCHAPLAMPARWCGNCGAPISVPQTGGVVVAQTQQLALLIGRSPDAAVRVDDPSVSARHAMLGFDGNALVLEDLGSRNGTFVDGVRIAKIRVSVGARVLVGSAPLPWDHPQIRALQASVVRLNDPEYRPPPGEAEHDIVEGYPADRSRRTPRNLIRWVATGLVGVSVLTLFGAWAVGALSLATDPAPVAPVVMTPAGLTASVVVPAHAADPTPVAPAGPYFAPTDVAVSHALYDRRIADQADPRAQEHRVRELRFRMRSGAVSLSMIGNDAFLGYREAWAVPLGVVARPGGRALAVVTTRCLVDWRYPLNQLAGGFANLALFSGDGRLPQVFRLASGSVPTDLSRVRNPRSYHMFATTAQHLDGTYGDRFFGQLASGQVPGVEVELPIGTWNSMEGVDLAVLFVPLGDPAAVALRLRGRGADHLGITDPVATLRAAMEDRLNLWGDTFSFSMVSNECMRIAQNWAQDSAQQVRQWRAFAVAAVAILVLPLISTAATAVSSALVQQIARHAAATLGPAFTAAARAAIWRTAERVLRGEAIRDVVWDESGRLVLTLVERGGPAERVVLAGVRRAGLDPAAAERVVATARAFAAHQGTRISRLRSDGEATIASVMTPDSQLDLSAELLRRGLAQLDTEDRGALAQQRGLVLAARDALVDPATRTQTAVVDVAYQSLVTSLAESVDGSN